MNLKFFFFGLIIFATTFMSFNDEPGKTFFLGGLIIIISLLLKNKQKNEIINLLDH